MRKLSVLIAIVLIPVAAYASMVAGAPASYWASSLVYDSGSVASGAAIDSGVVDVSRYSVCTVYADNHLGGSVRLTNVLGFMADGTTPLYDGATGTATGGCANVQVNTYGIITVGIGGGTAGVTNGGVYVLPPRMQFKMAAAGSAAGRLVVYCR